MTRAEELCSSPIGLQVLDLISQRQAEVLADEDMNGLLEQLEFYVTRWRGDYDEYVAGLKSRAATLAPLGEWLPQRMPRWWDDVDRTKQVWVGRTTSAPARGQLLVDLSAFDRETPKPKQALWTCTETPDLVSPWLQSHEKLDRGPETIWRITASPDARVAEIHSPDAWARLVRSHPRAEAGNTYTTVLPRPESSRRLDPDWSKVSRDFDGIHLSIGGWLTAEDVPLDLDGATTELRGWNMESTVWFRWVFSSVELLWPEA
jgi:hypothetical protein